jgi:hypothetical protein
LREGFLVEGAALVLLVWLIVIGATFYLFFSDCSGGPWLVDGMMPSIKTPVCR